MNRLIEQLQRGYNGNKFPELYGSRHYSSTFFTDWTDHGLGPAYKGFVKNIETHTPRELSGLGLHIYAVAMIGSCTLAATGLTTFVKNINSEPLSKKEKAALGLYSLAMLPMMAAWDGNEEDVDVVTYQNELTYDNYGIDAKVESVEVDRRSMPRDEANKVLLLRAQDPHSRGYSKIESQNQEREW